MSLYEKLFGRNPASAAQPYLNQIPGALHEGFDPYIQFGLGAGSNLSSQYQNMAADPTEYYNRMMQGYMPSKAYQEQRDEALRAAGNTAAAGGMRGTQQDIENSSRITNALLGNDMQQWYQNLMGIQGTGLQGQQNLYNTGFGASQGLTGDLSNLYGTQAQLAFQNQAQNNLNNQGLLGAGLGALGAMGGPFGSYLSSFGKLL